MASVIWPSPASATSDAPSSVRMPLPLPANAMANGAPGCWRISSKRARMALKNMASTRSSRKSPTVRVWSAGSLYMIWTTVCGASGSVAMVYRVSSWSGTWYIVRSRGEAGLVKLENRSLIMASVASTSTSPTTTTAIRSGRYQSV